MGCLLSKQNHSSVAPSASVELISEAGKANDDTNVKSNTPETDTKSEEGTAKDDTDVKSNTPENDTKSEEGTAIGDTDVKSNTPENDTTSEGTANDVTNVKLNTTEKDSRGEPLFLEYTPPNQLQPYRVEDYFWEHKKGLIPDYSKMKALDDRALQVIMNIVITTF